MSMKKNALGKGLAALIRDAGAEPMSANQVEQESFASTKPSHLPLGLLVAGRFQPRKNFDEDGLKNLASSIKNSGIVQPILVRPVSGAAHYEIIAGERRFRAAQLAELHQVPVIIRPISDDEALQIALIENLQREALSPIEEAKGFVRLQEEFSYELKQIAEMVGKSRSYISNMIRLLGLAENIQTLIEKGTISASHGRALLSVENPKEVAQKIISANLSVRDVERMAMGENKSVKPVTTAPTVQRLPSPDERAFVEKLSRHIGLPVSLVVNKDATGELKIRFREQRQLDQVVKKLFS